MTAVAMQPASPSRLTGLRSAADYLGTIVRHLAGNPSSLFGLVVISVLVVLAVFAPLIATRDPYLQNLQDVLQPPGGAHFFGTDEVGRDVFSRIVYGSRITLTIIALVAVIVGPIGLAVGTLAGYFGGWFDTVLMRITDIFLSFPSLILSLAFVAALGAGLENAIVAIALTSWPPIARLARAETLTLRGADYVSAAKLQGASAARIIWKQIVPMCMPSVLVRLTLSMATVILTAAGLGFPDSARSRRCRSGAR
jgi:peptide/nickel transport system permease protein